MDNTCPSHNARLETRAIIEALFIVVVLLIIILGNQRPLVRSLLVVFSGIVLEALPFMLLGSLAGGLIEVYVSREKLIARLPRRPWLGVLAAAAMGLIVPVCECAVVPVVKRLLGKGLPVPAAIAFLLGAPLVNPLVGLSTSVAYSFSVPIALLRLGAGYAVAISAAFVLGRLFPESAALLPSRDPELELSCGCDQCSDDDHLKSHHSKQGLMNAFRHASDDFVEVGQFLVMGAFIAALFQTVIERQSLTNLTGNPVIAILMMMVLAVLLNICSEADAFIAASFRNIMPLSAQMSFMLLGPMLDLKLVFMYTGIFRKKAIAGMAGVLIVLVLLTSYGLHYLLPGGFK